MIKLIKGITDLSKKIYYKDIKDCREEYKEENKRLLDISMNTLKIYLTIGSDIPDSLIKEINDLSEKADLNIFDEYHEIFSIQSKDSLKERSKEIIDNINNNTNRLSELEERIVEYENRK